MIVCFGEILWDVLGNRELPGGAPMNVAYHLQKMGQKPALITRIGKDARGNKLMDLLGSHQMNTDYIQSDPDLPTGLVYASENPSGEVVYDIVQPVAWDSIQPEAAAEKLVGGADIFVFGSLAARSPQSRNTLFGLLETARHKVLDINLRPPHFDRRLVEELLGKADTVKMNGSELELIAGWFGRYARIEDRMQLILDRFNIRSVITTLGGEGAMMNFEGNHYAHPGFRVTVADTIGSGDAFLAGLLSQVIKGGSPGFALQFACALGALVASRHGGWPVYSTDEVEAIINAGS